MLVPVSGKIFFTRNYTKDRFISILQIATEIFQIIQLLKKKKK